MRRHPSADAVDPSFFERLYRSDVVVLAVVAATAVGFDHLGGRHLRDVPRYPLSALDLLVVLEVVLIPLMLALVFMHARGRRWTDYGLVLAAPSWKDGAAILPAIAGIAALNALADAGSPTAVMPGAGSATGTDALVAAGVMFLFAVADELLRRGFLLAEIVDLLGRDRNGAFFGAAVLAFFAALGSTHAGAGGVLAEAGADVLLSMLYFASGRNLGPVLLARGLAALAFSAGVF